MFVCVAAGTSFFFNPRFLSLFPRCLNIFATLSVMYLPPVQAALSVSLPSDVSIKINVFSLRR